MRDRAGEAVYAGVLALGRAGASVMGWTVAATGLTRIPAEGPAVLAGNHVSYLDPLVLSLAAHRRGRWVRYLAKRELFAWPATGWALGTMGHIPVDRGGEAAASLVAALRALRRGEVVGVYPEGTLSRTLVPLVGKTGAARLALTSRAPLVPVAVWGGQRLRTRGHPGSPLRGIALTCRIGAPVRHEKGETSSAVTERLMARIRALVDEAAREYPQQPSPHDRWWLPAHLGGTAPAPGERGGSV